jgi:hypothetical protein
MRSAQAAAFVICVAWTAGAEHRDPIRDRPDQFRHEQLTAMHAAFSRFNSQGALGAIDRSDLPSFLSYVVGSMEGARASPSEVSTRSAELTQQLSERLPPGKSTLSLGDILSGTEQILDYPQPSEADAPNDRGRQGSKQLQTLRRRLERNRLTMPLFDTKGWVRDFEKALKIQWEIYANGFAPMHVVVARSDRVYGTEAFM